MGSNILRRKAKGLTLIELITVTAIIATITGAGMLSITTLDNNRLETDCRRVVADLSWAREMAANTRCDYRVIFDTVAETYSVFEIDPNGSPPQEVLRQRLQVNLASVTPSTQLTFSFPTGTTTDTTITLDQNGRTRQVLVTGATGYVSMQ